MIFFSTNSNQTAKRLCLFYYKLGANRDANTKITECDMELWPSMPLTFDTNMHGNNKHPEPEGSKRVTEYHTISDRVFYKLEDL